MLCYDMTTNLLANAGETTSLSVLVLRSRDPVDSGVFADLESFQLDVR